MYSEYMENTLDLTELLYNKDHSIRQIRCAFADGYVVEHVFTQCGHEVAPYRRITLDEAIQRINDAPVAFYDSGDILLGSHGKIISRDVS